MEDSQNSCHECWLYFGQKCMLREVKTKMHCRSMVKEICFLIMPLKGFCVIFTHWPFCFSKDLQNRFSYFQIMKTNTSDILSSCLLMFSHSSEYPGHDPLVAIFLAMSLFKKWMEPSRWSLQPQSEWGYFLERILSCHISLMHPNSLKFHTKWRKVGRHSVKGQYQDYHLPFVEEYLWK